MNARITILVYLIVFTISTIETLDLDGSDESYSKSFRDIESVMTNQQLNEETNGLNENLSVPELSEENPIVDYFRGSVKKSSKIIAN